VPSASGALGSAAFKLWTVALYHVLLDSLRSEDINVAVAGIALPNDASVALHRKFGFTEVGIFEEYAIKRGAYVRSVWTQRRL
jgi:phosphinothricin acetyltransferase